MSGTKSDRPASETATVLTGGGAAGRGAPPEVPDQTLLRCIGRGAFGEVWLSRTVTGRYRAVKLVYRDRFEEARPYEREFSGLKTFERVCLTHPGLVALLQVGRNEAAGYFYYAMEIADDVETGQEIDPERYRPKTLRSVLTDRRRLSLSECFAVGSRLAASLAHLQRHGLMHRDVKPSNIIFVNGMPKFADIGLVTKVDEPVSWVGTPLYTPPEGPGGRTSDLYSLGRVLYEVSTGLPQSRFPELPTDLLVGVDARSMVELNRIILRACAQDPDQRYPSAEDMLADLLRLQRSAGQGEGGLVPVPPQRRGESATPVSPVKRVFLLHKEQAAPDGLVAALVRTSLEGRGCQVTTEHHPSVGVEWVEEAEAALCGSDVVVVVASAGSMRSEMLAYYVELALEAGRRQGGRPRLMVVRVENTGPMPEPMATLLGAVSPVVWQGPEDDARFLDLFLERLDATDAGVVAGPPPKLEATGGAVPLDSRYYVQRVTDREFNEAIGRGDSIVLVKGARQIGKTSLLARGLHYARERGKRVVLTDFQKLDANHLASVDALFLKLGDFLADQLDLDVLPRSVWDERRSPNTNFERYLRREVLSKLSTPLVWGMDEMDRLFGCPYASEVFGLLRSWHNERALDPTGPWTKLTLVIAYATEAHLFITDLNQSPFNVGTRLRLEDFTLEEVMDLNARHGNPLTTIDQVQQFYALCGGQPYLVRYALNELTSRKATFADLVRRADREEGIFGDHLRRMLVLLGREKGLADVIRSILAGRPSRDAASFYRLRSAGLLKGDAPEEARLRCGIYETYLRRNLLEDSGPGL